MLEKVRGQAMTIREDAVELIKQRKTQETLTDMIEALVQEAKKLGMSHEEMKQKMEERYQGR